MNKEKSLINKDDYYRSITLHKEEWEFILAACEQMSCGYERSEPYTHCCDLNDIVPLLRKELGVSIDSEL